MFGIRCIGKKFQFGKTESQFSDSKAIWADFSSDKYPSARARRSSGKVEIVRSHAALREMRTFANDLKQLLAKINFV